ncbi:MAG: MurR/RpiR family transcriptional regulator [Betaproteobacteria bacterium]|nr:MurR/RpiR family transcriptional regulator [Betaproteobacteria bacterium]
MLSTTSADQLVQRISAAYPDLSKQLKAIALHIEKNRDHVGLEGIQDMARQCGVQPSAVVRFAKHFGFSGFTELQAVFRDNLSRQIAPGRNYQARIRDLIAGGTGKLSSTDIAREFVAGSIEGMQELQTKLDPAAFKTAVDLLVRSECVWIAGARRALQSLFIALAYALELSHAGTAP